MSEKGFLVDSEKTWRTGEVGVWRSEATYSKREREEGREGGWSEEKKQLTKWERIWQKRFLENWQIEPQQKVNSCNIWFCWYFWSWAGKLNQAISTGPSAGPKEAKAEKVSGVGNEWDTEVYLSVRKQNWIAGK